MRHFYLLLSLVVGLAISLGTLHAVAKDSPQQPNIVFLLADDLGWTGLRCFGSDFYETPNLDRFARSGMKFTDAYAACTVCSPTRASIMTGMYPARLHLTDFIAGQNRPWAKLLIPDWNTGLDHSYVTIAEVLREAGYTTAQIGKWHLNHAGRSTKAYSAKSHGFDVQIGKPPGTKGYRLRAGSNSKGESKSEFLTDYLTDRAVAFIDEAKDKPFFLYFAYNVPHTPIQGREDLVAAFAKKVRPDTIHNNPTYAAMVASLDQSVGRVLERLDRHGIADNTLVIFTSDNGGLTQRYGKHDGFTENLPLRRGKGSAYEGGVRVPTIVRWPGVTKTGSVCDEPISTIDYYPTLLDITSTPGNETHNASVDGKSIVPLLRDSTSTLGRDLYWHYPHYHAGGDSPYSAIRSGNWRLIEFHEDDRVELYDLAKDIGEQHDLALKMPQEAESLRAKLHRWREHVAAQMPKPNPSFDATRATVVRRRK
jgi:arylsulfatase A-like enzyme